MFDWSYFFLHIIVSYCIIEISNKYQINKDC